MKHTIHLVYCCFIFYLQWITNVIKINISWKIFTHCLDSVHFLLSLCSNWTSSISLRSEMWIFFHFIGVCKWMSSCASILFSFEVSQNVPPLAAVYQYQHQREQCASKFGFLSHKTPAKRKHRSSSDGIKILRYSENETFGRGIFCIWNLVWKHSATKKKCHSTMMAWWIGF